MRWVDVFVLVSIFLSTGNLGISYEDQDNTMKNISGIFTGIDAIMVDGNGDGDINDTEDYARYNRIYIIDTDVGLKLYPVYLIEDPAALVQGMENYPGKLITINGLRYLVTDATPEGLSFGLPMVRTVYAFEGLHPDEARRFFYEGDPRVGLGTDWRLMIVSKDSIEGWVNIGAYPGGSEITDAVHEASDSFDGYRVFIIDKGTDWVELGAVKIAEIVTIEDGEVGVHNYSKVRINSNIKDGAGRIIFFGNLTSLDIEMDSVKIDYPRYYGLNIDYIKKRLWGTRYVIPKVVQKEEEDTGPKEWRGLDLEIWDGRMLNISEFNLDTDYIKVDANRDGDLEDGEDYVIYNQIHVKDAPQLDFGLVLTVEPEYTTGPKIGDLEGDTMKVRGKEYLVTYVFENAVKMGEPVRARVYAQREFSVDGSVSVMDDVGFGMDEAGLLYVVKNGAVTGTSDLSAVPSGTDISSKLARVTDALNDYRVFLTLKDPRYMDLALVKRSSEIEIVDGQKKVFGYDLVRINNDDTPGGEGRIHFFGSQYNLTTYGVAEVVEAPYYQFEVNSFGELRIKQGNVSIGGSIPSWDQSKEGWEPSKEDLKTPGPDAILENNWTNITPGMPEVITQDNLSLIKGICGPGAILIFALLPLALIPRIRRGRWRS